MPLGIKLRWDEETAKFLHITKSYVQKFNRWDLIQLLSIIIASYNERY